MTSNFNPSEGKAPCYKCSERSLGCHDHCTKYQEFVDRADAIRLKKAEYACRYGDPKPYLLQQIESKRKKRIADAAIKQ